jgi:hypothetical protein
MQVCKLWILPLMIAGLVAGLRAVSAEDGGAKTGEESKRPIRIWTVRFVDGVRQPLADILVDTNISFSNRAGLQDCSLVSGANGEIKVPLREGECTSLNVRGPGWCTGAGFTIVGDLPVEWVGKDAPKADPKKPITVTLYPGVAVRGRLLLPNGEPARGLSLSAGVHCGSEPWVSEAYIENIMRVSFSVSEWPNWSASTKTEQDGTFSVTVPPDSARSWMRLGTHGGGFHSIDTTSIEKTNKDHPLAKFAPFEIEVNGEKSRKVDESNGVADLGELRLSKGIVLRGRVVDAAGRGLAGVQLRTSSERGPYAGRKTASRADGAFEFRSMNAGTFTLSPDAHSRDKDGKTDSRDVAAVFVSQQVTLREDEATKELVVRALPHAELEFDWVDRRKEKGPVAYYGCFGLTGKVPQSDGSKAWWSGETEKVTRGGREMLVVKVPEEVTGLSIFLHPDQFVTPSYGDERVEGGTGEVRLHDIKRKMRRVIYGDEPKGREQGAESGE